MVNSVNAKLVIVTPAKDEAEYIARTIASVTAQTHRPSQWIIVDDGSSDETATIAEQASRQHPWIKVLRRPAGTQRRVGPGVVDAFYAGLEATDVKDYDFVCKLDADLELNRTYFQKLLDRFANDPTLGTASGKSVMLINGRFVPERSGDAFSQGMAKLYRRQCFEEIGGFVREVMWDGIDCHRCRQLGWKAVSLRDPELRIIHLRQMGSSFRSIYHGRMRWGRGQYFMGTHPLYIVAVSLYRAAERPWIVGGICILIGYMSAWKRRVKRYEEPGFRHFLHRWQFSELSRRLSAAFTIRTVRVPIWPTRQHAPNPV